MQLTAVVFLGPTLPLEEAQALLPDAVFRPPVAQGDVAHVLDELRPDAIGIIDGVFYLNTAVWHKEILYALQQGVPVLGASSMGALRAAECAAFGMVGIGQVFDQYMSGELIGDDEVALAHGDAELDWMPLSEALVNVRATLTAAVSAGKLSKSTAEKTIAAAKELYFPERTKQAIVAAAQLSPNETVALERALNEGFVDVKRSDALLLLERLRSGDLERPKCEMNHSMMFAAFAERDRIFQRAAGSVRGDEIKRLAAIEHPAFVEMLERTIDKMVLDELAELWSVEASAEQIEDEMARLCWRLRIDDEQELTDWLADNNLDLAGFHRLAEREAVIRRLRDWKRAIHGKRNLVAPFLDELRLRGEYAEWADRAVSSGRARERTPPPAEPLSEHDLLHQHMLRTNWRPDPPLERAALEAGFKDIADLFDELALHARTDADG